jgi:hypothetical protein
MAIIVGHVVSKGIILIVKFYFSEPGNRANTVPHNLDSLVP